VPGRKAESCHPLEKGLRGNSRIPGPLTIGKSGITSEGAVVRGMHDGLELGAGGEPALRSNQRQVYQGLLVARE